MDGEDVTGRPVRLRNVSMVYQQFINYPTLTVFENIASPLRQARMAEPDIQRQGAETAEMLRIEKFLGACRWSCPVASSSARPWPGRWSRMPR
jgi:glycerol transport system ATP-binding protein